MALDKWIAVFFLLLSLVYGYAAWHYPLLPFERNLAFLPNTVPMVLSVLGAVFSLLILFGKSPEAGDDGAALGDVTPARWREYHRGQALMLVVAMIAYALLIRPAGFVLASAGFLFATGWILGERKPLTMSLVAITGALVVWLLVDKTLGIYLKPWPGLWS